jgi:hypothetical protein
MRDTLRPCGVRVGVVLVAALVLACAVGVQTAQARPAEDAVPSTSALNASISGLDAVRALPFVPNLKYPEFPNEGVRTRVVDYARGFSAAVPGQLAHARVGVAVRYVGSAAWKCMTKGEAAALHARGIDIVCVFETSAKWMLDGRPAGIEAAKRARSATIACGGPRTPFVYFACDTDTHNYAKVNACLAGAASVLGTECVGVYGGYSVCDHALRSGVAVKAWQTQAWSYGRVLPQASLYQRVAKLWGRIGKLEYDADVMRTDNIGQWNYFYRPGDPSAYNPWHTTLKRSSVP